MLIFWNLLWIDNFRKSLRPQNFYFLFDVSLRSKFHLKFSSYILNCDFIFSFFGTILTHKKLKNINFFPIIKNAKYNTLTFEQHLTFTFSYKIWRTFIWFFRLLEETFIYNKLNMFFPLIWFDFNCSKI